MSESRNERTRRLVEVLESIYGTAAFRLRPMSEFSDAELDVILWFLDNGRTLEAQRAILTAMQAEGVR